MGYCACCGLTSALFYVSTRLIMRKLGSAAQIGDAGFGVMVFTVAILIVMTFSVYRPLRSSRRGPMTDVPQRAKFIGPMQGAPTTIGKVTTYMVRGLPFE